MKFFKKILALTISGVILATPINEKANATSTTYSRGDINDDGYVNIIDSAYLSNFLSGIKSSASDSMSQRLDVDLSGTIDFLDKTMLSDIIVGNINSDTLYYETYNSIVQANSTNSYRIYNAQTGIQIGDDYTLSMLSSIPEESSRDIIGTDDTYVDYTKKGIVKLQYTKGVNTYIGTGFIVGDNLLLTAAHCTFNTISNIPSKNMTYTTFNQDGSENSTHNVLSYHLPLDYINSSESYSECDYALLVVNEDLSDYDIYDLGASRDILKNITGSTVYKTTYEHGCYLTNIYVTGYRTSSSNMVTGKGYLTSPSITNGCLFYDTDTLGGESGGPVYLETNDNQMIVIGIHNKGPDNTGYNQGKRIGSDILCFVYNNCHL